MARILIAYVVERGVTYSKVELIRRMMISIRNIVRFSLTMITASVLVISLISCGGGIVNIGGKIQLLSNTNTVASKSEDIEVYWDSEKIDKPYQVLGRIEVRNYGSKKAKKNDVLDTLQYWARISGADAVIGFHKYGFDLQHSGLLVSFAPETPQQPTPIPFIAAVAPVAFGSDSGGWERFAIELLQEMGQQALEIQGYYTKVFSNSDKGLSIESLLDKNKSDLDTLFGEQTEYILFLTLTDQTWDDPPLARAKVDAQLFSKTKGKIIWESTKQSSQRRLQVQNPYLPTALQTRVGKSEFRVAVVKAATLLFSSLPAPTYN